MERVEVKRAETPHEFYRQLTADIAERGPVSVEEFMARVIWQYYGSRDPFGKDGDFTTAPEISQLFGEMIWMWLADCWMQDGQPQDFALVEVGPGRGTLMADILRASKTIPTFKNALSVHLVEMSETLQARQQETLAPLLAQTKDGDAHWHESMETLPQDKPLFLIANEFLDALPMRQYQFKGGHWYRRLVGLDDSGEALVFQLADEETEFVELDVLKQAKDGDIFEYSPAREEFAAGLAFRIKKQGGAALLIDYGHLKRGLGDTLQAMKAHKYADVLADCGEVDLTSHVDFEALVEAAVQAGGYLPEPVTQGDFLKGMGIVQRAEMLAQNATDKQRKDLETALVRLTGAREMGQLFKVMAILPHNTIRPAGFATDGQGRADMKHKIFHTHEALDHLTAVSHGFFGRVGGVSEGLYESLNCGLGTADRPEDVIENRARVVDALTCGAPKRPPLVTLRQVHSAKCVRMTEAFADDERPEADAMVTDESGLVLGILTADCVPVLFHGEKEDGMPVIGAAHAGWGGALHGVLESTVAEMLALGAMPDSLKAVIGPCIRQESYEVQDSFMDDFLARDQADKRFFKAGARKGHKQFDLPGYVAHRLNQAGVAAVHDIGLDTYPPENGFFSYRRETHRKEGAGGRHISAIMIG